MGAPEKSATFGHGLGLDPAAAAQQVAEMETVLLVPQVVLFCAGWAMKFIPLLGRALKELALDGATQYDISHFAIGRPGVIKGSQYDTPPTAKRARQEHRAAPSTVHSMSGSSVVKL